MLCISLDSVNDLRNPIRKVNNLNEEQELVMKEMFFGNSGLADVLAVFKTGFGKSIIYSIFAVAKQQFRKRSGCQTVTTCVLVVAPLKNIKCGRMTELRSLSLTAKELSSRAGLFRRWLKFIPGSGQSLNKTDSYLGKLSRRSIKPC